MISPFFELAFVYIVFIFSASLFIFKMDISTRLALCRNEQMNVTKMDEISLKIC